MTDGEPDPSARVPETDPPAGGSPATGSETEEGIRAWLAMLDRKLGIRTYAGAAAVILALATAIVAVVLAVDARDNSASADDLARIENRLGDLSATADDGATAADDLSSLDSRLSDVEGQLSGLTSKDADLEGRIGVVEDDIDDLRGQISDLGGTAKGGSGGVTPSDGGGSGGTGGTSPSGN